MSRVAFLGGGSFGTALAILLANKGNDVSIYDRDIDVVNDINSGKNDKYIKGLIDYMECTYTWDDLLESI